jgi:hypothetical protein
MLPEHLWEATGLGGAANADLTATLPGALNSQLRVSVQDLWYESQQTDLALPIVQLNARSLRDWSALVMGSPQSRVAGRVFHLPETSADPGSADPMNNNDAGPSFETRADPGDAPQPKHHDADELVGNFRALVSKQAWQLGGVLSTIPVLTLPLMRVVQATLLPATDVTHLAELFIGGILREQEDAHLRDPDIVEYTFVPGVSELLIKTVSSYDAIAALSLFVERHLGRPINFFALLEDPSKAVGLLGLGEESEAFAALTVGTLRRLGGSFARVADELERNILPNDKDEQQLEIENPHYQIASDIQTSNLLKNNFQSPNEIAGTQNINDNDDIVYESIDKMKYEVCFLRLQRAKFGIYDAPKYIENDISNMESKIDAMLDNDDVNIYRYVDDKTLVKLLRNHQLNAIFINDQIQLYGGDDYAPRILMDKVYVENREIEMLFDEYKNRNIDTDITDVNIYGFDADYEFSSDEDLINFINIHLKNLRKLMISESIYTRIYLPISIHYQINETRLELDKIEREIKNNRNIYSILNIQKNNIINEKNHYMNINIDDLRSILDVTLQNIYKLEIESSIYPPFDIPIYLSNQIDDARMELFEIIAALNKQNQSTLYHIDNMRKDNIEKYSFLDEETIKKILDTRLSRLTSLINESKQYTDITMPLYLVNMIELEENEVKLLQEILDGLISANQH